MKLKDIPWYEWLYAVTEDWKVWSYPKYNNNIWRFLKHALVVWYPHVILSKDNKTNNKFIHRLVALTYLPNPNNYPIVRHLDNNKQNNHVSNLEWCTHKTNNQQAHDDWLFPVTEKFKETARKNWLKSRKKVMQLTKDGVLCMVYESLIEASKKTWIFQSRISWCARKLPFHKTAWWYLWKYL